ncbi:MAG: hypothetical protein BWX58_00689 [Deltaproteobacteria bacterium ADurb.Bin026]|jgi:hypothetical protein|nr:hypothetical protein [Syntrophorhabdaceae bacterium]OQC49564.1 MAG: hypothetical protein BWX58_00689 [Deltaproteobacteria bacterium ADurb.Bin026]
MDSKFEYMNLEKYQNPYLQMSGTVENGLCFDYMCKKNADLFGDLCLGFGISCRRVIL